MERQSFVIVRKRFRGLFFPFDTVFFHFAVECRAVDAELLCSGSAVPIAAVQHVDNMDVFDLGQGQIVEFP